jgi:hypothetical protein
VPNPAYAQLLSTAPGSCATICDELSKMHGVKLAGANYNALWNSIERFFGARGAATIVEDIVEIRTKRKTLERVMGKREKIHVESILFEDISKSVRRGRANLRKNAGNNQGAPSTKKVRKKIVSHDHIVLPSVEYGLGITKGNAPAYQPIDRVTPTGRSAVRGRSDWLENNLENYLEAHWAELDFGLGLTLSFKGRQQRLSNTHEKVDLLATMGEVIIPIELKIKRAGGSDLTQLQSYRKDLINRGREPANVLGILVAPVFSSKVLNVVSGTPGIILRWFELPL